MSLDRPYSPHSYDPHRAAGSFWEATAPSMADAVQRLEGDASCDIAIVGAGYTGLSAALRLAGTHGRDVMVLDAAYPGWGASGRNGGFCCIGGAKLSDAAMSARYGLGEADRFVRAQIDAVALVRDLLDTHGIDADARGEGELVLAHRRRMLGGFEAEATHMRRRFGIECELLDRDALLRAGAGGPEFHGGVRMPVGFGLNPLKYVQGLARAAMAAGARVHGHTAVTGADLGGGRHVLHTQRGRVTAKQVIFATNGYSAETLPGALSGRLLPVFSNVMVTRPLSAAERDAQGWTTPHMAYDTRKLLHYFRLLPDGRFLFGARGGTSDAAPAQAAMRATLRADFERMFPAWSGIEATHTWCGLACLSYDLVPYAGPIAGSDGAWASLAYHGNGVALGTWSGQRIGDVAAGALAADALPAVMRGPFRRFPLPGLRPLWLRLAYLWYGFSDERA